MKQRTARLAHPLRLYMKGKGGPRPAADKKKGKDEEQPPNGEATGDKPAPVRCAGCESTEVQSVDSEGFYYCENDKCIQSSRGEIHKLTAEEFEKVRAQNAAAGAPLPPSPEEGAALQDREVNNDANTSSVPPFPRKTDKVLAVKMTDMELSAYRTRMSDEIAALLGDEEEKKRIAGEITERIKEHKKEIAMLSAAIENGVKHEAVDCEWRPLWEQNAKILVRLDTGETVDTQPLSFEDRQLEMKEVTQSNQGQLALADDPDKQDGKKPETVN